MVVASTWYLVPSTEFLVGNLVAIEWLRKKSMTVPTQQENDKTPLIAYQQVHYLVLVPDRPHSYRKKTDC